MPHIHPDDDHVPLYTETDNGIHTWLDALDASALSLPLTQHPGSPPFPVESEAHRIWTTQSGIFESFFKAIRSKNTELVVLLVSRGLISPNAADYDNQSPLIAAVDAGNPTMVRCFVDLGADVNSYALWEASHRTALQVAAAKGNLVLVKLLMEECGADDALIAPDGQLALRLAAESGHGEVVEYLPLRRGGEWRRWQIHHELAMKRIRKAGRRIGFVGLCIFWYAPVCIVWYLPKYAVYKPIQKSAVYCLNNRRRFGGWCKRQVKAIPERTKRAAKAALRAAKKVPEACKDAGKFVWEVTKAFGRMLKRMPGAIWRALKAFGAWIWVVAKKFGGAIAHILQKFASLLHTMVVAVVGFFQQITLKDVWDGFCTLLRAIFVGLPKAVWSGVEAFGDMTYKVMKGLFGFLGATVWWIIRGVIYLMEYVPKQVGVIVSKAAGSVRKGAHEVLVWYNPKRA